MANQPEQFKRLLKRVYQNDPDLVRLELGRAALNQEDIALLAYALAHNTHLIELKLNHNRIDDECLLILLEGLAYNNTITTLDLDGNRIGPDGAAALANNKTMTTLALNRNHIGDNGARVLANNKTITELSLQRNNIGDGGAIDLANNKTIKCLFLSRNNIGPSGARALANNKTITELHLEANDIRDEGAIALANNKTITALLLDSNRIGPDGVGALANNKTMTTLGLSENHIGDNDVRVLANNKTITTLDLRHNHISDEGAIALANNKTITALLLESNDIGSDGAIALANNKTITTLGLSENHIGVNGARALANNKTITTLGLSKNHIGVNGARALANNKTITTLGLYYSKIGDEGVIALVNNNSIIKLVLNASHITNKTAKALLAALKKNTTLTALSHFDNGLSQANRQAIEDQLQINQACPHIIKEQIQTLMNIRGIHQDSPLAFIPNELMFLFFEELMPGFHPNTFMQQKFLPVDETTMTKARNKLKAIAAQQGLSIRLEAPAVVNPPAKATRRKPAVAARSRSLLQDPNATLLTHYYAVTTQTIVTRENKTPYSTEELRQVFSSSTHCFLYTTAAQAQKKRLEGTKELMFWRTTAPLEFMVTTSPIAEFTEGMRLEPSQMNTIVYLHARTLNRAELLRTCEHERQLKQVVANAYDEYDKISRSTTSTSSSDTGYSISSTSTSQLEPRHTAAGVTRALAFKESLESLEYVDLIEKMKDFASGRFNGGFDPGKSFKAILYEKLVLQYGTQAQRERLPTAVINKETLLAIITEAEKQIKQRGLQDLFLKVLQEAPREGLVKRPSQ